MEEAELGIEASRPLFGNVSRSEERNLWTKQWRQPPVSQRHQLSWEEGDLRGEFGLFGFGFPRVHHVKRNSSKIKRASEDQSVSNGGAGPSDRKDSAE